MNIFSEALDATGTWVRLCHGPATVALERMPGPHGSGSEVLVSDGTTYRFDHLDTGALDGPEAVYLLVTEP